MITRAHLHDSDILVTKFKMSVLSQFKVNLLAAKYLFVAVKVLFDNSVS
jgi:hypothetical protein